MTRSGASLTHNWSAYGQTMYRLVLGRAKLMNAKKYYSSAAQTATMSIMDQMPCSQLRLIGRPVYKLQKAVQHVLPLTRSRN